MTEPNGSTPKIGKPVTTVPFKHSARHTAIWAAVTALAEGEWLPVTFDTPLQARRFQAGAARTLKRLGWHTHVRSNVAYISKRAQ